MRPIGVLALQGGFPAHLKTLRALGIDACEVRRCLELESLSGLILPGGESTALLKLMGDEPWFEELRAFHARGGSIYGTCAGAILLAREVRPLPQACLGLIDAVVARNAYGRQVDSFETRLKLQDGEEMDTAFIRAPRILEVGAQVAVLARLHAEPVLIRQGNVLAGTFHPELTGDPTVHRLFAAMCGAG